MGDINVLSSFGHLAISRYFYKCGSVWLLAVGGWLLVVGFWRLWVVGCLFWVVCCTYALPPVVHTHSLQSYMRTPSGRRLSGAYS